MSNYSPENHDTDDQSKVVAAKWGPQEKLAWLNQQKIQRSYLQDVVSRLQNLSGDLELKTYGALDYAPKKYPLYILKSKNWHADKKTVLVSGGVHGYETSGVLGAISFAEQHAANYSDKFNLLIAPCISPWAYETVNRWNYHAIDPNRSFYPQSPAQESAAIMQAVKDCQCDIFAHIDLHETTDTDNSTFRPALAARDGVTQDNWNIPDGFYLVGDTTNPADNFQMAIIQSVEKITHIAPADENGLIIGERLSQKGVINYPLKRLGLCAGFTNCQYATTTEVYPDSPLVNDQNCIDAQVAAITGGLDYLLKQIG